MTKREIAEYEGLYSYPNGDMIKIEYDSKQKAFRFIWVDEKKHLMIEPKDIVEYLRGLRYEDGRVNEFARRKK
jgi:hypothetical protein